MADTLKPPGVVDRLFRRTPSKPPQPDISGLTPLQVHVGSEGGLMATPAISLDTAHPPGEAPVVPEAGETPQGSLLDQAKAMLKGEIAKTDGSFVVLSDAEIIEAAKAKVVAGGLKEGEDGYQKALDETTAEIKGKNDAVKSARTFIEVDLPTVDEEGVYVKHIKGTTDAGEPFEFDQSSNANPQVIRLLRQLGDEGQKLSQSIDQARRIIRENKSLTKSEFIAQYVKEKNGDPTDSKLIGDALKIFDRDAVIVDQSPQAKENAEKKLTPEQKIAKNLDNVVNQAINLMGRAEMLNHEDEQVAEYARLVYAQLTTSTQVHVENGSPDGLLGKQVRELFVREALGSYQAFCNFLTTQGQLSKDMSEHLTSVVGVTTYQDVGQALGETDPTKARQAAVDRQGNLKSETLNYIRASIGAGGGIWSENIDKLINEDNFNEAAVALLVAGDYAGQGMHPSGMKLEELRRQILKNSHALERCGLIDFFTQHSNDISIINRALFGGDEDRKKIKDNIANLIQPIVDNNFFSKIKRMHLGGMFFFMLFSKLDSYLSTGVEVEQPGMPMGHGG